MIYFCDNTISMYNNTFFRGIRQAFVLGITFLQELLCLDNFCHVPNNGISEQLIIYDGIARLCFGNKFFAVRLL